MIKQPALLFLIAIAAAAAAAGAPGAASAEVYRCTGPDGRTVFTDNPAACPGAKEHEPVGKVQTIETEPSPEPAAPDPGARGAPATQIDSERAQKEHWQQKKRMKEEELRRLEERHAQLAKYVTACNRGMEVISRDETGIKYRVSCDQVREEYEKTEALQKPIREYLETGLALECRQAGCLPGWIR
jgi:hypothetical protein